MLGLTPAQFMQHYEDMRLAVVGSTLCKKLELLNTEHDEVGPIQVYASHVNSPTRLISDRAFVDAKYMWPDDNLIVMASAGNEQIKEEFLSRPEQKGLIVSLCVISGLKLFPMTEPSNPR